MSVEWFMTYQASISCNHRVGVMMRTLKISTYLAADLETVKSYLMTPALLAQLCGGWFNEIPSYRTKFLSVKMG